MFIVLAFLVGVARAQLVTIGPEDPSHCDREEVTYNLEVREGTAIRGKLTDETGAPFDRLELQLRELNNETLKTVTTGRNGDFDLGSIEAGKYRLVALTRAFKQPQGLQCWSKEECVLEITLKVESTDGVYSQCPPK